MLAVLSAVTFFVFFRLLEAGAETYHLPFVGVGTAIAGGLVALEAIIRRHERGLLLAGPIIWGLMWAGFLAGEFTNPH